MGFVGLTLADLVVNSESMLSVLLRIAVITAAAVFLIVTAVTKAWTPPPPFPSQADELLPGQSRAACAL